MRDQLHRHAAILSRGHGFRVAGKKGADGFADLPVTQQASTTQARFTHIVADIGEVVDRGFRQRVQQVHGVAGHAETAGD